MVDTTKLSELFSRNRQKLTGKLPQGSLAVLNSNDVFPRNGDQDFPFRQNSDLFYLTGIRQAGTHLLISPDFPDKSMREILFIRQTDPQTEQWEGKKLTPEEAADISGINTVRYAGAFDAVLNTLMSDAERVFLNSNEYPKYSNPVPYYDLRFAEQLRKKYPLHRFERLAPVLHQLRVVKENAEVDLIRKACTITGNAFKRVLQNLKPGMKEFEVQAEITYEFMKSGAFAYAYPPIIASGARGCFLHYTANNGLCRDNELLLMDFGAEYGNYAADVSRTVPVNGHFNKRQKECYHSVLDVQKRSIALFRPGTSINEINGRVNRMMEEEMIRLGLFSRGDVQDQPTDKPLYLKYFMHGVSHFIGLDVHDAGSKYQELKPGMVLTCEPGLYLPDEHMGIRIENVILVREQDPVDLTAQIPRDPEEIEELMGRQA